MSSSDSSSSSSSSTSLRPPSSFTAQPDINSIQHERPIALSNREEDDMRKKARARALKECDDFVKAFADCATGRTVSVAWACRPQHRAMLDCMRPIAGEAVMQDRRREYLLEKRSEEAAAAQGKIV